MSNRKLFVFKKSNYGLILRHSLKEGTDFVQIQIPKSLVINHNFDSFGSNDNIYIFRRNYYGNVLEFNEKDGL